MRTGILYTTAQAAKFTRLSQERIRQYCRYKGIEKYGRDYLIEKGTIDEIVARRQRK